MLSASTIKAQQKVIRDDLVTYCTIQEPQETDDGYGVKTPGFIDAQPNVPVRLQSVTRVPRSGEQQALGVLTEWQLVFAVGTVIKIGWRVLVGERVFDIEDVDDLTIDHASITCFSFSIER